MTIEEFLDVKVRTSIAHISASRQIHKKVYLIS